MMGPPVPAALAGGEVRSPFMPERLADLVSTVLVTAPEIRSSRALRGAADAERDAARWLRFPSVSVNGNAFGVGSSQTFASELQVDQPIWAGGRIGAATKRAEASQALARAELRQVRFTLAETAVDLYFRAASALARTAILDDSIQQHVALVDRIDRRVDAGISPVSDLALAQSRTAQEQQNRALAEAERRAAEARLAELLDDAGFALTALPAYRPVYHPPADGLFEGARLCDPQLDILRAQIDFAEAEAAVAQAEIMPQLSVQYSRSEVFGDRVGLALRAASVGGLSPLSLASAARQRAEAGRIDILSRERTLREEIAEDLVANQTARVRIATGRDAVRLSERVRESYFRQYVAGRRTWLDLMNAVREAASADLSRAEAEITAIRTSSTLALRSCQVIGFGLPGDLQPGDYEAE
jgi:adhesin transport system outer membrane protein